MDKRKSGILLHISSLPGKYGIGDFGKPAYQFVDFLKNTGQKLWQILPLGQTGYGNSPYSSFSAFAGNILFIDIESLPGFDKNLTRDVNFSNDFVEYEKVKNFKIPIIKNLSESFLSNKSIDKSEYNKFKRKNKFWLDDYAFFISLKENYKQKALNTFAKALILRKPYYLKKYYKKLKKNIEVQKVIQFFFFKQWLKLKEYANNSGIEIIGDIPLYVAADSADVWVHHELFMLDKNRTPIKVAGVPPDYFSETGQLWGNPVYDWQKNKKTNFKWWIERLKINSQLFDIVRIDHFRGLEDFWAVEYGKKTAVTGKWLKAEGEALLKTAFKKIKNLKLIAEDLGIITKEVEKLRDDFKLPGMKILQFAFDSDEKNNFLPHTYTQNSVVYTGTHDNDTSRGWYEQANKDSLKILHDYYCVNKNNIAHSLICMAWASVSVTAIAPLQDIINLDTNSKMNVPGTTDKNWEWRFSFNQITDEITEFLSKITKTYGR